MLDEYEKKVDATMARRLIARLEEMGLLSDHDTAELLYPSWEELIRYD